MEYRDYYAILGVPKTASQAEIKKAYRKLARQSHPDVNKGDAAAERRFKEVNEAHAVLGDPEKRKAYDELGANWEAYQRAGAGAGARGGPFAGFGGFGGAGSSGPGNFRFEYRGDPEDLAGFSDFFRTFFGGGFTTSPGPGNGRTTGRTTTRSTGGIDFEDLLGGLGGEDAFGGRATRGDPYAGAGARGRAGSARQDAEADAEISLEEAFTGTTRLVQVGERRLEVSIPPGVETGQRIRLRGEAGSGPEAGDLYLRVTVREHPLFTRKGADLHRELPVTLREALLGAEVPVPTLTGRVVLRIPPETQNGRTFRLAGQGMPRFRDSGRGDLYVRLRVVLPTRLDEDARRRARDFLDSVRQPDPRASEPRARTTNQ